MQWIKKHIAVVTAGFACVLLLLWAGFLQLDKADVFKEKQETGWIHEECDYTDYYINQRLGYGGVCTHDLSYTEPEIPAGKYYPGGNTDSGYYLEISEENGKDYFEYKYADGGCYGDSSSPLYGKTSYTVHTYHFSDDVVMITKWHERTALDDENDEFIQGLWPGEKIIVDEGNHTADISFDDSGSVLIQPYDFGEGYNHDYRVNGVYLSMPAE